MEFLIVIEDLKGCVLCVFVIYCLLTTNKIRLLGSCRYLLLYAEWRI